MSVSLEAKQLQDVRLRQARECATSASTRVRALRLSSVAETPSLKLDFFFGLSEPWSATGRLA